MRKTVLEGITKKVVADIRAGAIFHAEVKDWRRVRKLSQSQAAKRLGVKVATLQQWEHGRRRPANIGAIRKLMAR